MNTAKKGAKVSRWFRHYAGMIRDRKITSVALRSKQTVERAMWVWSALLESAAELNDGGRFEVDLAEMAFFLRCDEEDIASIMTQLGHFGRINGDQIPKWADRQFESDKSTERVKRFRDKKKDQSEQPVAVTETSPKRDGNVTETVVKRDGNVSETAMKRFGNAPETETETESDTETESKNIEPNGSHLDAVEAGSKSDAILLQHPPKKAADPLGWPDDYREQFWALYPNKVGKKAAYAKLAVVRKADNRPHWDTLIAGLMRYINKTNDHPWCHPTTWLNAGRWEDQPTEFKPRHRPEDIQNAFVRRLAYALDDEGSYDYAADHTPEATRASADVPRIIDLTRDVQQQDGGRSRFATEFDDRGELGPDPGGPPRD